ncbi:glycerophosphodiester phosphodiesterase [Portibacter lacus]|uniref:Glycerophosphoryl diester phosphodiesterase n=1 Tax=Portibacter lacus TaxID=1099794 RepID=A0AA37SQD6_9BACT|nr:glycerophosphodiester phosphodiesterase family protein [Portibacter lacus]GLR15695.1 glycerophosphoryl diester phosphodiesterase [Portibacter lacus]
MKTLILLLMTTMTISAQRAVELINYCNIIGHRGAPGYGGENTLWGFQKALDLGADGFELDVIPTKDGKLIVGHDFDLKRLLGKEQLDEMFPGRGYDVINYTQAELQTLKITYPEPGGDRYDYKTLSDEYRMPTLGESIDLLLTNRAAKTREDLKIYIEIKTKKNHMHTTSLNKISAQVTAALEKRELLTDVNVWIQSFDYEMMDVIAVNPKLNKIPKTQLAFDNISEISKFTKSRKAKKYLKKQILNRNLQMLHVWKVPSKYILENKKVAFIQIAREMGIPIHLYTFRDPNFQGDYKSMAALGVKGFESKEEELKYFMLKGVDAIMTDYVTSAINTRTELLNEAIIIEK